MAYQLQARGPEPRVWGLEDNVLASEGGVVYVEVGNDQVPDVYKDFFDNADWTIHKFVVVGSWSFLIVAIVAHILVWLWRPW